MSSSAQRRCVALVVIALSIAACAPKPPVHTEAEVQAVFDAFYGAIKRGDPKAAMSVIAPDAMFVESGKLETREQYEKNHLPLDIDFERQITGKRGPLRITFAGDTAWIIVTTEYDGKIEGGDVAFASSQLMVLTKDADSWKIRSIHWSSAPLGL
jgi:ketosteroid isomerase-like protein